MLVISVQVQRGTETDIKTVQVDDAASDDEKANAFAVAKAFLDEQQARG